MANDISDDESHNFWFCCLLYTGTGVNWDLCFCHSKCSKGVRQASTSLQSQTKPDRRSWWGVCKDSLGEWCQTRILFGQIQIKHTEPGIKLRGISPDLSSPTSAFRSVTCNLGSTTLKYRSSTFFWGSSTVKHGILTVWWIHVSAQQQAEII